MITNKEIRRQASQFLLAEGRLGRMAIGVSACIAASVIPFIFFVCLMYFASIIEGINQNIGIVLAAVAVLSSLVIFEFFTIPVFDGFFKMSYRIYKGAEDTHLADIFSAFASPRRHLRATLTGVVILLRAVAILIPILLSFSFIGELWQRNNSPFAFLICFTFTGFALFVGFGLAWLIAHITQAQYFVPYYLCMGNSFSAAITLSRAAVKKRRFEVWGYLIGLLPTVLLSLATLGVLFVVYSAPMMIFAYFIHCEKMTMIER